MCIRDRNDIGTSSNPAYFDMNYTYLKPTNGSIAESKIDLSSASSNNIDDVTYTGNPIEPNVVLTLDNKTLKLDEDYTITYSNNTSVGTGEIIINGINRYTGTKTISFKKMCIRDSNNDKFQYFYICDK